MAIANEAAAAQGRFWEMRDALIREAPVETERQVLRAATNAGLNLRRFERDWALGAGRIRVDEDILDAQTMQLDRAPVFYVDDIRHEGPLDTAAIAEAIAQTRVP